MNTTSKPWDHLHNAKHIDRIIASWNRYPDSWVSALRKWRDLVGRKLQDQAYYEARAKCKELDRWDIWDIWYDLSIPHIDAILVLIAYDDCAHYLDMPSQELLTFALLGVAPAVLLLEAVIAFEEIAKISHR